MALPEDFNKIYGSTATGGLTPINNVDYAKGWEFVGSNPPTKNDFSYLQNLSDLKSQWLYNNKLQRTDPFGDIKSDGAGAVSTALENLGLGAGAPAIGIPFFWPLSAMPNTVLPEWANMVFLKFNNSSFSAVTYPQLAKIFPSLVLPDARGEFPRIWDDGRGVDSGRALLSAQGDAIRNITASMGSLGRVYDSATMVLSGAFDKTTRSTSQNTAGSTQATFTGFDFDASRVVPTASENRPRNIAFNFLVRAK